ncbi:hypothetical protein TL16_g01010 [Triparma laevis f. inornata]|uniref:RING-type domain-containing protein n=1 Tax=Triparma laevis f. inornata TaxID=1714386 RepID=A0A9W6ZFS0_9STRA|nr:hypothetical protein TL16_g01010 [Triparma laevis f. inornata]
MSKPVATQCSSSLKAQETSRKRGREDEEKEDRDGKNEGSAAEESTTTTTQKSTTTTTSTTLKTSSKGEEKATFYVCMLNELSAKIRPCGHTVTCGGCMKALMERGDLCPFCRKGIEGYDLSKWSSVTGTAGLWPTLLKNLSELASGEGFNDYFRDSFNGNEAAWRRWKEIFDVLGIAKGGGGSIESQVLGITNSEDLVKLRALAELCSKEFFDDQSLLVVAWRRIMKVLETRKKVGEVKSEKEEGDAKDFEILDACAALGRASSLVGDFDDARRYFKPNRRITLIP